MGLSGLIWAAALHLASAGGAPEAIGAVNCATNGPDWRRLPINAEDYMRAYPANALKERRPGRGVVDCAVAPNGKLQDCRVVLEEPAGSGFGDAALKLTRFYRFRPPCPGENGRITLPILFNFP
jgi:protein TonB